MADGGVQLLGKAPTADGFGALPWADSPYGGSPRTITAYVGESSNGLAATRQGKAQAKPITARAACPVTDTRGAEPVRSDGSVKPPRH